MIYLKLLYLLIETLLETMVDHYFLDGWRIHNNEEGEDYFYEFYLPNWVLTFLAVWLGYYIGKLT